MLQAWVCLISFTGEERKPDGSLSTSHLGIVFLLLLLIVCWIFHSEALHHVVAFVYFNVEQSLRANHLFGGFSHITSKHQNELFQSFLKLICEFAPSFSHFSFSSSLVSDKVGGTGILQDHDEQRGCEYQPFCPRDMPRHIFSFRYLKHFTG